MPILTRETALSLNRLLMGMPADHVPSPNGDTPAWQVELVEAIKGSPSSARLSAIRTLTSEHPNQDAIIAEIFIADRQAQPTNMADLHMSDTGNAEMIASMYGDRLRFDHIRSKWLVWTGNSWKIDDDRQVRRMAIEALRARLATVINQPTSKDRDEKLKYLIGSESRNRLDAMLDIAGSLYPLADNGSGWDADPFLLGTPNGVINLANGELRGGWPGDRITKQTGVEFDPKATCPRWLQTLHEVFDNDTEMVSFFQKAVGYSVTGDQREQCLFLCHGSGANGKSTVLTTLRAVLGDYAANTPFNTFEMRRGDTSTNDLAGLSGARFVTASETNESNRLNEARVKSITGGDPVTARFLFGEYFTFQPTFKIWLAMNHLPTITGTDDGIWRRVRLIPFTVSFRGREDAQLVNKLNRERAGILAWAVEGARRWLEESLAPLPGAVTRASNEYRDASDMLLIFLDERTVKDKRARIKSGSLYQAYKAWCNEIGERAISLQLFGAKMKEHGYEANKKSGNKWYEGIGLPLEDLFQGDD